MGEDSGEIKTYNADKYIAIERDLVLIVNLMKAFRQARTGETPVKSVYEMNDNEKIFNKVSGLTLVIHSMKDLVLLGWTKVKTPCLRKWDMNKDENKVPFEEEDNDFNKLMYIRGLLKACEEDIREADLTPSLDDDFMLEKTDNNGEKVMMLTKNYFEMLDVLEETWPQIEYFLYRYAVLSQGFIKDEDITEKEKEEELKRRILNG